MKRPTLRTILLAPILLAMTLGFLAFGLYVDRVETANRLADIDEELVRASLAAARDTAAPGPAQAPPGRDGDGGDRPGDPPPGTPTETTPVLPVETVVDTTGDPDADTSASEEAGVEAPVQLVVRADGRIDPLTSAGNPFDADDLTALIAMAPTSGATNLVYDDHRVRLTSQPDGRLAITALSLDGYNEATSDFRRATLVGGALTLAVTAAIAWGLATFLMRPLNRMTQTANRIADGELDTTISGGSGSRETVDLGHDLDRMLERLRATLHESEQSAAVAARSRDDMQRFLADMAHELRTPLTALKGYSDLYEKGMLKDTEDVDRAMSRIGSESERLNLLANEMLQLARDGLTNHAAETVDLAPIAQSVADDLGAAHPDQRIDVVVGSADSASGIGESAIGHLVSGVPAHLHQAILNLASNACHFSPRDQAITIALDTAGAEVSVQVIDHGPGVPMADRARIFLPFFKAEGSRTRDGAGATGLGLALTKQIAQQHGGVVEVTETPGGGATFTLTLPSV